MEVQTGFSSIGVFLLLPLLALVVLVLVLLIKKPKAGLVVLVSLFVVGGLSVLFSRSWQYREESPRASAQQQVEAIRGQAQAARSAGGSRAAAEVAGSGAPEWSPEANQFEADVYPSARAAVGALAGRVESQIDKAWQGAEPPAAITLVGPDWPYVFERIKQAFRNRWPLVKVTEKVSLSPSPEAPKQGELKVAVRFPDNNGNLGASGSWATSDGMGGSSSDSEMSGSGRAVLTVQGPAASASAEAAFVDKPWADDLGKFLADHPAPGQDCFVVSSPTPCASASEARNRANAEAASRLTPLVRQAMDRRALRADLQGQALADRLESELQRRGFVQDQFLQRFHRPYGDVWKQSLLIVAHPAVIDTLAAEISWTQVQAAQAQQSTWSRTALSIAGLVVLICLVYLFLNAVTKGYYAWPLRTAAVVVGLLALAAVFALLVLA